MTADVLIIGAGIAGLACARAVHDSGSRPLILEASDAVGGRIRTDSRDGFLLDRGFQVLQTWYPAARHALDYQQLDLRPFAPGALIRFGGRFHRISDVWRQPSRLLEMALSTVGTPGDKLRLMNLRRRALSGDLEALYSRPETDALSMLRGLGFTPTIIERFFKPFFAGVFFEPEVAVSSRSFEFVFRAFALGNTALPARGMGSIPAQLAASLPPDSIRLNCRVRQVSDDRVLLGDGDQLKALAIVVATDAPEAARLLGRTPEPETRGTTCYYFAAEQPPIPGPDLVVNGEGSGLINSLLVPSNLSKDYAPPGQHLVNVNLMGLHPDDEDTETRVRQQLRGWFGSTVDRWRRLMVYRLPRALPKQAPPVPYPGSREPRIGDRLWQCSELGGVSSIHWALDAGRRAGESVNRAVLDEGHRPGLSL